LGSGADDQVTWRIAIHQVIGYFSSPIAAMKKKILLMVLMVVVIAQFIRPPKNASSTVSPNDISFVYEVPDDVMITLKSKCYDCHSNTTVYPWYAHVQPVGWYLYSHVREGKKHLDFSEYKTYSPKRAAHKMEEIADMIREREMPLQSYLLLHPDAEITSAEEAAIVNWISSLHLPSEGEE
jgi:hypothetical protein